MWWERRRHRACAESNEGSRASPNRDDESRSPSKREPRRWEERFGRTLVATGPSEATASRSAALRFSSGTSSRAHSLVARRSVAATLTARAAMSCGRFAINERTFSRSNGPRSASYGASFATSNSCSGGAVGAQAAGSSTYVDRSAVLLPPRHCSCLSAAVAERPRSTIDGANAVHGATAHAASANKAPAITDRLGAIKELQQRKLAEHLPSLSQRRRNDDIIMSSISSTCS